LAVTTQINQKIWISSLIGSLIVVTALYSTNGTIDDELFEYYIAIPAYMIIPAIPVGVSLWALIVVGKTQTVLRKPLIFFTASFGCWFVAEQIWLLYWYVLDIDPFPSTADFFYIAGYPLMFAGLIVFLIPLKKLVTKISLTFATIISVFVLIPSLVISFLPDFEFDIVDFFFAIIYPFLDSLILAPAIIILISFSWKSERNSFWIIMVLGIIIFVAADTLFLFLEMNDSYYDGHPIDTLWLYSNLLWAFAIYRIIYATKIFQTTNINQPFEITQDYQVKNTSKFGIPIMLVIINLTVIMLVIGVNYLWQDKMEIDFPPFMSVLFLGIIILFSLIVAVFNKKMNSNIELQSSKLVDANSKLIKAERLSAVGSLASRMSHDLRNPLAIIQASLENLKALSSPNEEKLLQMDRIGRSINRITHQVEGVLDFVREKPMELEKISMSEIIAYSLDSLVIPDKIKLILPKNDVKLFCDKKHFSIVMTNLILNGIQANDGPGTVEITIEKDNDTIVIQVKDSGKGIPKGFIDEIFEPLFTTKQTGTGLGLASVKSIIDAHGGIISATSPPTIFTITLPNAR